MSLPQTLQQTIMHFNKLGGDRGVEIGGTKGKDLTASVRQTHVDFEQVLLNPVPYQMRPWRRRRPPASPGVGV